jgi:hypothetical protein
VKYNSLSKRRLREVTERHLMIDAMRRVARGYPGVPIARPAFRSNWFWSWVFVPVYRHVPWAMRERAIKMTGMGASGWTRPSRRPGEPWQPPRSSPPTG